MNSVTVIGARSLFRAGLVDLLSAIGFAPIEEVDTTAQLGSGWGEAPPPKDMLIIALARGAKPATETVRDMRASISTAKVVCLVPEFDLDEMRGCFAAGACGYLLESISRDALRESLRLVAAGEKVFPSELAVQFPELAARSHAPAGGGETHEADLSNRELQILQCLANGQSNKVIAKNLDIAEATVKVHVKRILRKAHALNRTQAALWAIATGVASPPELSQMENATGAAA